MHWTRAVVLLLAAIRTATAGFDPLSPPPKREVRAVWVATAAGLDWPKSTDRSTQQSSLRSIVQTLRAAHFNTIFFQVRARGDAYYRSTLEPWAENLTGTLGADPGWDPLRFLLEEAHQAGMEVHAWFNVFKVRGPNPLPGSSPLHVTRLHPEWTVLADGELWLDPGLPEARRYTLGVAIDLITRYDLDGINFDFVRYPGRSFPDDETYRRFGNGAGRDAWRRANVTAFIADFHARARALKPGLKIGSSPLGVYESDPASGTTGSPQAVFQESETWLKSGLQDYLSPQVYWDIGASRGDPDFAGLVRRWQEGSGGRHIYAGIAAYKAEVLRELVRQIDESRAAGNSGQVFFRYDNLLPLSALGDRYQFPAISPPMSWKDSIPPKPPTHLAVSEVVTNVFQLEWKAPPPSPDGETPSRYVVYRGSPAAPRTDYSPNIIAILPGTADYLLDTVRVPTGLTYYYTITALDRANNESDPSTVGTGVVRELLALKGKLSSFTTLAASFPQGKGSGPVLLGYSLARRQRVLLQILQHDSVRGESASSTLVDSMQDSGPHVLGLTRLNLRPGRYTLRLQTDGAVLEQPLPIRP